MPTPTTEVPALSPSIAMEAVAIDGPVRLSGTLTRPEPAQAGGRPLPGVLFLAGSGPVDRDENAPGLPIAAFRLLAEVITPLGFVTLRYDKRGIGESEGDFLKAGLWDLVDDAERALAFLRRHPAVDPERIVILGHSEGAMLAPAVHLRRPVQGLILLSGAARSLREIITWQGEALFRELERMPGLKGHLVRLLRIPQRARREMSRTHERIVASTGSVLRVRGQRVNAKWLREHFEYDVADDLARVDCPALVITGGKDLQVPPEEAEEIARLVAGPVEHHLISDMNHVLRQDRARTTMLTLRADYRQMVVLPLHPDLVALVTAWLSALFNTKPA